MIKSREITPPRKSIDFKAIYQGTLLSFYISLFFIIVIGLIMYYSNLSENWLSFADSTIFVVSAFIGGFSAAKKAGYKALYHGLGVGILYIAIALALTMIFIPTSFDLMVFSKKLFYSLAASALGGIAGVAFK